MEHTLSINTGPHEPEIQRAKNVSPVSLYVFMVNDSPQAHSCTYSPLALFRLVFTVRHILLNTCHALNVPGDGLGRRVDIGRSSETEPDLLDSQFHTAGIWGRGHEEEILLQVIRLHSFILQERWRRKRIKLGTFRGDLKRSIK